MTFGSLFAGIGGFDLGFERAGLVCKWQVEIDIFCRKVLEKHWPTVERHDDIKTFPPTLARCWRVDVICGGFPCQDISDIGHKVGIDGKQSGLWSEFARVIRILRPRFVVVENVASLSVRGIDRVLGDLAAMGFNAKWDVLSACAFGAPHTRERMFIVADASRVRRSRLSTPQRGGSSSDDGKSKQVETKSAGRCASDCGREWWLCKPEVARVVNGFSTELGRSNRAIGNSVSPFITEFIGRQIIAANS